MEDLVRKASTGVVKKAEALDLSHPTKGLRG